VASHCKGKTQIDEFDNKELKRIFGHRREEVRGEWKK
jgi:hypothetical protein